MEDVLSKEQAAFIQGQQEKHSAYGRPEGRPQVDINIGDSYMHSPMEGHAHGSRCSMPPPSRSRTPRGGIDEPTNKAGVPEDPALLKQGMSKLRDFHVG